VLPVDTWTHLAATYDRVRLRLYVNGIEVANRAVTPSIGVSSGPLTIGGDATFGQYFDGRIDEVRVYNRALSAGEIQTDMITAVQPSSDPNPPTVSIDSPTSGATVSHVVRISATAQDDVGVSGVEFLVNGVSLGTDTAPPYSASWNTTALANGPYTLTARATDLGGNQTTSAPASVAVQNPAFFNEVVVPDITAATTIAFLPGGRMLVGELTETIWVVQPGANEPDPVPFLQLDGSFLLGEQGLMDICLDPNFASNGYIYVFYTRGASSQNNHNRLSRFTATGNSASLASELVLWQDDQVAQAEHHGGSLGFGSDGKLYFTQGEQFLPDSAQSLNSFRGKIMRINPNGSIPTDNPFYDGNGPNKDAIWAYGLRNPFRMAIDPVTGRILVADVGGNVADSSQEEINLIVRGANYGWPLCEGPCGVAGTTDPIYWYGHAGRDASITGGFFYRGGSFPAEYEGSFFFADYVQNWIKRLTFDASGAVDRVLPFEPPNGSADGPFGDPVKLVQGPDGAIYYVDIGFNDQHVPNPAAIRRLRYALGNLPPVAVASANPTSGLPPLQVAFSSAGSFDPEDEPLSYLWEFGDGATSTQANPTHTYQQAGPYVARLRVSDSGSETLSADIEITVGNRPVATINAPADGAFFRAGDLIVYTGGAFDTDDGTLPPSALTWTLAFLHDSHVHPAGGPFTGTSGGTLSIPSSGHDFEGNTRYEISLAAVDSDGLRGSTSVVVWPEKVNLHFDTQPTGLAVELDGIRSTTPFDRDSLIGFEYLLNAPVQSVGGTIYEFSSWSDGGGQSHPIVVPQNDQTLVATFVQAGPVGEATGLRAGKSAGSNVSISFVPACGATNHVAYMGTSPIGASVAWTGAMCSLGTSGTATFNPGTPTAGRFIYWVVVGQNASLEGSYGLGANGLIRPEAVGVGTCDKPRGAPRTCP
jgi:glucose/arabinose dehydrogenase